MFTLEDLRLIKECLEDKRDKAVGHGSADHAREVLEKVQDEIEEAGGY